MVEKQKKKQEKEVHEYNYNINIKLTLEGLKTAIGNPLNDILKNISIGVGDTKGKQMEGGK